MTGQLIVAGVTFGVAFASGVAMKRASRVYAEAIEQKQEALRLYKAASALMEEMRDPSEAIEP